MSIRWFALYGCITRNAMPKFQNFLFLSDKRVIFRRSSVINQKYGRGKPGKILFITIFYGLIFSKSKGLLYSKFLKSSNDGFYA